MVLSNYKLYIMNAGDSMTLVAVCTPTRTVRIIKQTRFDRPTLPKEQERIQNMGGRVSSCGRVMYRDIQENNGTSKWRPGVAMSRSIGDADMVGVIPEPLVDIVDLHEIQNKYAPQDEQQECFLLVLSATDGLTDVIPPKQVVESIANAFLNDENSNTIVSETIQNLMNQAATRWNQQTGGSYRDDMTLVASKVQLPTTI